MNQQLSKEVDVDAKSCFIWHHECHKQWAKEDLYFFRLVFHPTYNSVAIFSKLLELINQSNITSYAAYELTGEFDILLRVWLPDSLSPARFEDILSEGFKQISGVRLERFTCDKVVMHWVWDNGLGEMHMPAKAALATRPSDDVLSDLQHRKDKVSGLKEDYSEFNCLRDWRPSKGIRFMLEVPRPEHGSMLNEHRQLVQSRLHNILKHASSVFEVSIYRGTGFAEFIALGKVKYEEFDAINDELIRDINDLGIDDEFDIRTKTSFLLKGPKWGVELREEIPIQSKNVPEELLYEAPIEKLLDQPEGKYLEFKGTAFLDVKHLVYPDKKKQSANDIFRVGVAKAVVGMLNSRGGRVVIGVLEKSKFQSRDAQKVLGGLPVIDDYIVAGLELDSSYKNWDDFLLRLNGCLKEQINPAPWGHYDVRMHTYRSKTCCVITVKEPHFDWFYIKDECKFYHRYENSTEWLIGREADHYKTRVINRNTD